MVFWRTWLLGLGDAIEVQKAPPVPTTNWRMPLRGVGLRAGVLRREPLVVVGVTAEDHVRVRVVERVEQRLRMAVRLPPFPELKLG